MNWQRAASAAPACPGSAEPAGFASPDSGEKATLTARHGGNPSHRPLYSPKPSSHPKKHRILCGIEPSDDRKRTGTSWLLLTGNDRKQQDESQGRLPEGQEVVGLLLRLSGASANADQSVHRSVSSLAPRSPVPPPSRAGRALPPWEGCLLRPPPAIPSVPKSPHQAGPNPLAEARAAGPMERFHVLGRLPGRCYRILQHQPG